MREIADQARIEAFLAALAREATGETAVYLVGGTSAVLIGWRPTTIDIDLVIRPESDAMLRAIPLLKERLSLNVELASPDQFIPVPPGAEVRRQFDLVEPQLYRFPAIDPPSFRRAVDEVFPP